MNTRRSFIKTVGTGTALSALSFSVLGQVSGQILKENSSNNKPIRIGIIGGENSHTIGFGKLFNIDKKFRELKSNMFGEKRRSSPKTP